MPAGLVPSLEDLKAVEEHIKAMEKEKVRHAGLGGGDGVKVVCRR